ncbi:uncharacterized protein [Cicer arietinum]|uniref:uncharacterized protein isoform X2 n=1 Tax=Cicer arietinum TaxID=3827 RepID=UPI003CC6926C
MGLNARDIQLHLFRVIHISIGKSFTFMKKHPKVSCALLVFFIMYIFLSCIYNLLLFLSPFLVFTSILVRIFWSSEQTNIGCVEKNGEEKRVEAKNLPNMVLKNERRGKLYKYPSHNATSRRRNFTRKKLDVYGDLEQKAKDLSAVFRNDFTKKNTEIRSGLKFLEKEMDPLDYKFLERKRVEAPEKPLMISEPSMVDLVTCSASNDGQEKRTEKIEDEKKAIEDSNNKGVEIKEDDQKKLMDLGISEMESNKRLESLIARRRARKQLKLEIENGLIDIESISPSQIAPLLISRINPFDSPRDFDDIEMPGSAPTALRSPFDIPYEPFEEKPNLKGDIFYHEFANDLPLELRQDLEARENKLANQRLRRLSGMGNHDRPEKLNSKEGSESELQASNPSNEGEETTHEEEGKCKIDMVGMKSEEVDNGDPTNSISNNASEPITNVESIITASPKPQVEVLDFPISTANVSTINDSLYESLSTPVDVNEGNMLFTKGLICHTPSCSLASDLQVEFSEIGSPTLTIDESHENFTFTDGEYHVDKDLNSLHNNDEENAADVSSMASKSEILYDTPIYAMSSDHNNILDNVRQTSSSQYSSDVLARWKRLMRLMDTRVNHLPSEILSENLKESNQIDNLINKEQVVNDVNNSEATKQDNTEDLRCNEEPGASGVRQEATDEISTNSSSTSSSSPSSVLPIQQKTTTDQEIHIGVQQSDMEDVAQEIVNGEGPLDSMSQNIHPFMDDPHVESHNNDLDHSQERTNPLENSIQESNMSNNMNNAEVCNQEDQKLKNDEKSEDKFTPQGIQDASAEPHRPAEVPLIPPILESSSEIHIENEGKSQASSRHPFINDEEESDKSSENHSSKEENYLQSELNQMVIGHIEKEQLDKGDISEDFSMPTVTEVTNAEDTLGEPDKMNKSETTDQELHKNNQTMVLSDEETDKEGTYPLENSIQESSMFKNMNGAEVCNQEDQKLKNDEISEDKITSQSRQDASAEPHKLEEVPTISPMIESSLEIHIENEGKSQDSLRQPFINDEVVDTSSFNDFEGKHNDLNENEGLLSSCISSREIDISNENHSSKEENFLQNESNQVVIDDTEKEQLDKGDISEDSSLPMVTEVTNAEDTLGEYDNINKNEITDQELHKNNQTMVISELDGETDKVSNIAHVNDP